MRFVVYDVETFSVLDIGEVGSACGRSDHGRVMRIVLHHHRR